jgi:hypothetical protein
MTTREHSDPSATPSGPEKAYVRICEACSQQFEPARKHQRFCSAPCRARYHRERKLADPRLAEFFAAIQGHLVDKGRMVHGERGVSDLAHEIQRLRKSLQDVAACAFILDCRLDQLVQLAGQLGNPENGGDKGDTLRRQVEQ